MKTGEIKMKISLKSKVFENGELIPSKYTCDGANISPPLKWGTEIETVKTFAIIADEPDAPDGSLVHWILFNIPASINQLHEDVTPIRNIPEEILFGTNDFGHIGYNGPCPSKGIHKYQFKIYGLDSAVHLEAGATVKEIMKQMEGHIIAEGKLIGKYKRQK